MHNALTGLPTRVIIDANVLLNACFVINSSARNAVDELFNAKYSLAVDAAIEHEAMRILGRMRIKLALSYDPILLLRAYMSHMKILALSRARGAVAASVNAADRHVYYAAITYSGWVLTSDVQFALQCRRQGLQARLPWDVIIESSLRKGSDYPLSYDFRYDGLSRDQGAIFARVFSGSWAGIAGVGKFTVFEAEKVGKVLYDSMTQEWMFQTRSGKVGISCDLNAGELWTLSASYKMQSATCGHIILRIADPKGRSREASEQVSNAFGAYGPGFRTFGHSVLGKDHWNGALRHVVVGPRAMNKGLWKALIGVPEATPDPSSGNLLEKALVAVRFLHGDVLLPTRESLLDRWI